MITVLILANFTVMSIVVFVALAYFTDALFNIHGAITGSVVTVFETANFAEVSVVLFGAIICLTGHSCL
jgi:hypothetical protein